MLHSLSNKASLQVSCWTCCLQSLRTWWDSKWKCILIFMMCKLHCMKGLNSLCEKLINAFPQTLLLVDSHQHHKHISINQQQKPSSSKQELVTWRLPLPAWLFVWRQKLWLRWPAEWEMCHIGKITPTFKKPKQDTVSFFCVSVCDREQSFQVYKILQQML